MVPSSVAESFGKGYAPGRTDFRGRGFCGGGAEGGGQESETTAKTEGKDEAD